MVEYNRSTLDDATTPLLYATQVGRHSTAPNEENLVVGEWACPQCTLLNPSDTNFCEACEVCKPRSYGGGINVHVEPAVDTSAEKGNQQQYNREMTTPYSDDPNGKADEIPVEAVGEDPLSKKKRRRRRRRVRMVFGGVGGLVVGSIVFCGPVGTVVGAVAGVYGARVLSKRRERKNDERVAHAQLSAAVVD